MSAAEVTIRPTTPADAPAILAVHLAAASNGGGLAREPDEMSLEGITKLSQNKDAADRAGVVAALGEHPIASRMREL